MPSLTNSNNEYVHVVLLKFFKPFGQYSASKKCSNKHTTTPPYVTISCSHFFDIAMRHFSSSSRRLLPLRIAVFTCIGVVAVLFPILPIHAQARPDSSAHKELMESLRAYREKSS
jgi:hypothetical protein